MAVNVSSTNGTQRSTSVSAFLPFVPSNLEIWTESRVTKLLFSGKKAIGAGLLDGRKGQLQYTFTGIGLTRHQHSPTRK